jgi:hypothetical protein
VNPRDFIGLADALIREKPDDEAARRSVVSRAYYGAFNTIAEDFAANVMRLRGDASDHVRIGTWLRRSGVAGGPEIGDLLNDLRDRRNDADYRTRQPGPTRKEAETHLEVAKRVVRSFDALPRPALHDGVKAYLRTINELK